MGPNTRWRTVATVASVAVAMSRNFRLLWASVGVSSFGNALTEVALPLLALFVVGVSPTQLGVVVAVEQLAWLVLGLFAGVWVDRWPRRTVLVASDLGRAVLIAVLPVAYLLGQLHYWLLVLVGLLVGVGNVFAGVAHSAVLPEIVQRDKLIDANAKVNTLDTASNLSGSAVVGPLVAFLGAPAALAVDALSFLGSALLLKGLKMPRPTAEPVLGAPQPHFRRELADGLRIVVHDPLFRTLTFASAAFNAAVAAQYVLGLLFLKELDTPTAFYGVLLAAGGVGALLGSIMVSRLSTRWGEGRVWRVALVAGPVLGLAVPLAQPGLGLLAYALGTFGLAAAVSVTSIISFSLRQALCPVGLMGRVAATTRVITWGVIPVAAVAGGWLGGTLGVRPALWIVAGCLFAEPLIIRATRVWAWQAVSATPTEPRQG